jgi:hypothetical protein
LAAKMSKNVTIDMTPKTTKNFFITDVHPLIAKKVED